MSEPLQVPKELHEDLLIIADKIEPYARMVVEKADQLEENAADLASKIEPAAEKLGAKMEQGAHEVRLAELGPHHARLCCGAGHLTAGCLWDSESALQNRSELSEPAPAVACTLCCIVLCTQSLLVWRSAVLAHVLPCCGVTAHCDLMDLHAHTGQITTRCAGKAGLLISEPARSTFCRWLSVLSQWQTRQLRRFRRRPPAWHQRQSLRLTRRQTSWWPRAKTSPPRGPR